MTNPLENWTVDRLKACADECEAIRDRLINKRRNETLSYQDSKALREVTKEMTVCLTQLRERGEVSVDGVV